MELMGREMAKWWDRKWRLVIAVILLPLLVVPVISLFLFPEMLIIESLLYGALISLLVALALRILQQIELLGLKVVILMLVGAALLALSLSLVFRIWPY
jgi:hypothetical protein